MAIPVSTLRAVDASRLCNPYTGEPLRLEAGELVSVSSGQRFPIREGIPSFIPGSRLPPRSRIYRWLYDRFAFAYDFTLNLGPKVRYGTEAGVREEVIGRLPVGDGEAVLETAAGTALNRRHLPKEADYYGLDISWKMLRGARRNLDDWGLNARLFHADTQYLPFHDNTFEHVIQMGGLQFIHDPFRAAREMGRVAKPGATVTILDEAASAWRTLKRMPAHAAYAKDRASAIEELPRFVPQGMQGVKAEVLPSGEFYLLSFRKPG
ncbi:MAG: methyltransferase domain-containing protein [Anaerolineae bacterium]|nr:methyltransferase domain-containing protein [Anaerolineae bacterium]